jgi:hypothetical protein
MRRTEQYDNCGAGIRKFDVFGGLSVPFAVRPGWTGGLLPLGPGPEAFPADFEDTTPPPTAGLVPVSTGTDWEHPMVKFQGGVQSERGAVFMHTRQRAVVFGEVAGRQLEEGLTDRHVVCPRAEVPVPRLRQVMVRVCPLVRRAAARRHYCHVTE